MAQALPVSQAGVASGGGRSVYQPMVVVFERDESLAGMVLGQLLALGYECRAARIPVEVFDLIARYPVGLVLINLGQAATGRRDFWVALESKQRERSVQYLTYRSVIPGARAESEGLLNARVDVMITGPQSVALLVERVQGVLPPPARPVAPAPSPLPAAPAAPPAAYPSFAPTAEPGARPAIAGVLNLTNGQQAGQPVEFAPLPGATPGTAARPAAAWLHPASAEAEQRGSAPEPVIPGATGTPPAPPPAPATPLGSPTSLAAAISALDEAGAPGYHYAAAAAQAMDQASPGTIGEAPRRRESGGMSQEARPVNPPAMGVGTAPPSGGMNDASGASWRPSGGLAPAYHYQMSAPVPVPGQVERSLSTVLVEGQLISQQRLEIALGIQRLLRGADLDYRLGELLLMFKFLTPDQLLAALLVSRGMVTPAQVAAMGRIKQELHHIGMEYDLENLLILFRLLTSEQLREIRSEFP